jgi:hypothetical protein
MIQRLALVVAAGLLVAQSGCRSGSQEWEITAENQSAVPCSIAITYGEDGRRNARVDELTKGKAHVLVAEKHPTIIRSVKVIHGKDEWLIKPDAELPLGKRYVIVVAADGKVLASVRDK